jgi:AcrR family transcriptional regulator
VSEVHVRRRPGPRSDLDVPVRLVDVAERLFGDASVGAVSLRAVAREAGVAPAAVRHHFATKQDLLNAVVDRRAEGMAAEIVEALSGLRERRRRPTARELVNVVLVPFVRVLDRDPVGGLRWMKILASLAVTDDEAWLRLLRSEPSLSELFLDVATRVLPHTSESDLQRRAGIAMYGMLIVLAGSDLAGYGRPLGPDGLDPAFVEQLAVFTSSGIRAAATA